MEGVVAHRRIGINSVSTWGKISSRELSQIRQLLIHVSECCTVRSGRGIWIDEDFQMIGPICISLIINAFDFADEFIDGSQRVMDALVANEVHMTLQQK